MKHSPTSQTLRLYLAAHNRRVRRSRLSRNLPCPVLAPRWFYYLTGLLVGACLALAWACWLAS